MNCRTETFSWALFHVHSSESKGSLQYFPNHTSVGLLHHTPVMLFQERGFSPRYKLQRPSLKDMSMWTSMARSVFDRAGLNQLPNSVM